MKNATPSVSPLKNNGHIHTPFSFSAFKSVQQAVQLAKEEGIKVLGINDFFVTDGYSEFATECKKHQIYPLFNIEFIALDKQMQADGIRVNDPANPGRIYISGKGLRFPFATSEEAIAMSTLAQKESQKQMEAMISKLNDLLLHKEAGFTLSSDLIYKKYARNLIRERHLARAMREEAQANLSGEPAVLALFTRIYGSEPNAKLDNINAFEEEIRGKLLKAGGAAYVAEDEKAFPSVEAIKQFILDSGGIPTYPLLADDAKGGYTDFEEDIDQLINKLNAKGFFSVEFIPGRNNRELLEKYATKLYHNGFIVTFGTEHNTPAMIPLTVSCRGAEPLGDTLELIGYNGVCAIAAHQHLIQMGKTGYCTQNKTTLPREELEILGDILIRNKYNHESE